LYSTDSLENSAMQAAEVFVFFFILLIFLKIAKRSAKVQYYYSFTKCII